MRIFPHSPLALLSACTSPHAVVVAAAAAAAATEAKFRFGLFRKFTVDSEDSLAERERERKREQTVDSAGGGGVRVMRSLDS